MPRKTREDFERERQALARADLMRATRGLGDIRSGAVADAETEAVKARQARRDWKPHLLTTANLSHLTVVTVIGLAGLILIVMLLLMSLDWLS